MHNKQHMKAFRKHLNSPENKNLKLIHWLDWSCLKNTIPSLHKMCQRYFFPFVTPRFPGNDFSRRIKGHETCSNFISGRNGSFSMSSKMSLMYSITSVLMPVEASNQSPATFFSQIFCSPARAAALTLNNLC